MMWILLTVGIVSLCVGLSLPTIQTSLAQQQDDQQQDVQQQQDSSDETSSVPPVSSPLERANEPPIANAGPDQTVRMGAIVTLDGTGSYDREGQPLAYSWTQTSGPKVTLNGTTSYQPTFTSPDVGANTTLTFSLEVNNGRRGSDADTVNIIVMPPQ